MALWAARKQLRDAFEHIVEENRVRVANPSPNDRYLSPKYRYRAPRGATDNMVPKLVGCQIQRGVSRGDPRQMLLGLWARGWPVAEAVGRRGLAEDDVCAREYSPRDTASCDDVPAICNRGRQPEAEQLGAPREGTQCREENRNWINPVADEFSHPSVWLVPKRRWGPTIPSPVHYQTPRLLDS